MRKQAMFSQSAPTLGDLINAIERDAGISPLEKISLKQQIRSQAGTRPDSTPLSSLPYSLTGGAIGVIIAKYFKLGTVGQLLSSAAGFGVGRALYDKIETERSNPYRGFKVLW